LGTFLLSVAAATAVIWVLVLAWQAEPQSVGGSPWASVPGLLVERLHILAAALGWTLAVLGVGCALGSVVLPALPRGERWLFRAGLGVGATAVLVLVAGALGTLWAVWAVWVLGPAALARWVWVERRELREALGAELVLGAWEWLWVLVSVVVLILALFSVFLPPLDYDVLEYHLGVPVRYLEAGRITALPTNVYSNFPLTGEMHYLVGLSVLGKVGGGCFAKLFNLFCSVCAGLGVAALAWKLFGGRSAALLALATFATTGWLLVLACTKTYVEPVLTAFTVLAFLGFLHWLVSGSRRGLVLTGLMVGFACGTKYPAALFLALPLAGFLGMLVVREAGGRRRALTGGALFVAVLLAAFSPWLIKNVIVTGNPVFPLVQGLFDGGGWTGAARSRWAQAHALGVAGPATLLSQLRGLVVDSGELPALIFSPAAFIFLPLLLLVRRRRFLVLTGLGYVVLCVGLWLLFTHRIQRFLVPTVAVAVALSAGAVGTVRTEGLRRLLRGTAAVLLAVSLFMSWPWLNQAWAFDLSRPGPLLGEWLDFYPACEFAETLPAGEKVLSVGEARSFYFGPSVHTETVFDPKLLDMLLADGPQPLQVARRLKERGFTHIFVNWRELARLQSTYAYEFGGRSHAGYSERIDSSLFQSLEDAGAITVVRAWGPSGYTVESPEGWLAPSATGELPAGADLPDGTVIVPHQSSCVIYRIEGTAAE